MPQMAGRTSALRRRLAWIAAALAVLALLAWAARVPILRSLGAALVHADPLVAADAIAVTLASGSAGTLTAADLVAAGVSRRVLVFATEPGAGERELARRGVASEGPGERQIRQLHALGVADVAVIPGAVAGSHDEVARLLAWCSANHARSVVLVTTADHSRRLRRLLDRSGHDGALHVMVHPASYSAFDPAHWWTQRATRRTGIVELEKLLLDVADQPVVPAR